MTNIILFLIKDHPTNAKKEETNTITIIMHSNTDWNLENFLSLFWKKTFF